MEFEARTVTVNEGRPVMVGFADDALQPKNYVLLSYDPNDLEQGLHIEVNDQIYGGYDLVRTVQVLGSQVLIHLTSAGKEALKCVTPIHISVAPSVANWQESKGKIAKLFEAWVS